MRQRLLPLFCVCAFVLGFGRPAAAFGVADQTDPQPLSYRTETGPHTDVARRFTPEQLSILEMLNRADVRHLSRLTRIVVPSEWRDDLAYSPFPPRYAPAATTPKLLVVDQPTQAFAAYEHGTLVYWGPVSTGRQAKPTPTGRFHLNWKARSRLSTLSGEWMLNWYFNFHNRRGLAFHEFDLPGVPASHACVRLLSRDAQWIYKWGESWVLDAKGELQQPGTPVVILGSYDFTSPPPYRSVDHFGKGITLPTQLP